MAAARRGAALAVKFFVHVPLTRGVVERDVLALVDGLGGDERHLGRVLRDHEPRVRLATVVDVLEATGKFEVLVGLGLHGEPRRVLMEDARGGADDITGRKVDGSDARPPVLVELLDDVAALRRRRHVARGGGAAGGLARLAGGRGRRGGGRERAAQARVREVLGTRKAEHGS